MSGNNRRTLDVQSRSAWRDWLGQHHASDSEIWLVFHKQHRTGQSLTYEDAVEEALCFGWVDSIVKRVDDDRYLRKFTPRKADSRWSTLNRRRYEKVKSLGLLAAPGLERAPTDRSGDAPKVSLQAIPAYIEKHLRATPRAWQSFEQLAPSHQRLYIAWIDSAKREETKERRLHEAANMLAAGKKLGLK